MARYQVDCFVRRCAHPRALHSFPTRRSSDLHFPVARRELLQRGAYLQALAFRVQSLVRRRGGVRWLALRSEEHTSELQSRQYLVCRLLLEKKNAITRTRPRSCPDSTP